ncbi:MAG: CBS domain-containing protein [Gammaproteobacteria bacterium]|nr:CBS domain-containing protein [Gammaproteobacteria bacterium]
MTRHCRTVNADTPLREVVSTMTLYRISGLPVIDDDETMLGFIAEKDVLHYLFPSLEDSMNSMVTMDFEGMENTYSSVINLKVSDLMSGGVISVSADMPILKATSIMVRHRFRRIPVTDGKQLVGMLSMGDVHKALFKKNIADVSVG